jgi:hypothetical protein
MSEPINQLPTEELLKLQKQLQRDLDNVIQYAPEQGFFPHPGQYRDIVALDQDVRAGKRKILWPKGNGYGKSWLLGNTIGNVMWPKERKNRFFANLPLFQEWPFPKHIRLLCNAKQLKEGSGELWKTINRWWPKDLYKAHKDGYDYYSRYEVPSTGFIMDVMTFDQPPPLHESSTLGAVFSDEPPPYSVYMSYPRAFRHGGFFLIAATLVTESFWIEQQFIEDANSAYRFGDVEENCKEHSRLELPDGIVLTGHLEHSNIDAMVEGYSPEEREARKSGKPIHLRGCAFDVTPHVHFIPRNEIHEAGQCSLALDPHQRRPWVIAVARKTHTGDMIVVDEWPKEPYDKIFRCDKGIKEYALLLDQFRSKWNTKDHIIDAKFAKQTIRKDWESTNLVEELDRACRELGLAPFFWTAGNTKVEGPEGGTAKIKSLLYYQKNQPVDFTNRPMLYIANDLHNSTYQIQKVSWKEEADPSGYGMREVLDPRFLDYPRVMMYLAMADNTPRKKVEAEDKLERSDLDMHIERKVLAKLREEELVPVYS